MRFDSIWLWSDRLFVDVQLQIDAETELGCYRYQQELCEHAMNQVVEHAPLA